jgi:exopolysaccharide biosynthesis polyprenyl glycosylphosphotransferase
LISAYTLKFKVPQLSLWLLNSQWGVVQQHAQIEPYLSSLWVICTLSFLCLQLFNGYQTTVGLLPGVDEFIKIAKAMGLLVILITFVQFFVPLLPGSRSVMLYFWGFAMIYLLIFRLILLKIEHISFKKGIGTRRAIIIGTSMISQDIAERILLSPGLGYFYVGFVDDAPPETIHYHLKSKFRLLGTVNTIESVCATHNIDAIFLVKRDIAQAKHRALVQFSLANNIQLNVLSDPILDTPFMHAQTFDGRPMATTISFKDRLIERHIKRLFDVITSAVIGCALLPIFAIISVWIKRVSPNGPVIYKQARVGHYGREFNMLKFRSMIPNAEAHTGPVMVNESGDTRYIKGGQFLRQFSLDELPQLWNVFCGHMSLVGPRPERPHFVKQFSGQVPYFNQRHVVPVGITGWAQINGRSVLTRRPEHKIKYDIYYINHWSLLFDIKILLKTMAVVLSRQESY